MTRNCRLGVLEFCAGGAAQNEDAGHANSAVIAMEDGETKASGGGGA